MAFTLLHRCKESGEAILMDGYYQQYPPFGKQVGTSEEKRGCDVCSSINHDSTVTVYEFDAQAPSGTVQHNLGAPWVGTQEGIAVKSRSRAATRAIDDQKHSSFELGSRDGYGAGEIYISGPPNMTLNEAQMLARAHLGDVPGDSSFQPTD